MILKGKDSLDPQMQRLQRALNGYVTDGERRRIEKDLNVMRSGIRGEEEAAYHIDFHLKDSLNWAVIHDLRLECRDRVAQIDHLLIGRFLDVYVVESKNYKTKVRCANGGWERLNGKHWEGIPDPVEQNRKHVEVLRLLFEDIELAPTRLGVRLKPNFVNVVLVAPSCSIIGQFPAGVMVVKMDTVMREIWKEDPGILTIMRLVSQETVQELGARLAAEHKPSGWAVGCVDETQLGVPSMELRDASKPTPPAAHRCDHCKGPVSAAEALYCRKNNARFAGKTLCRKCQIFAPNEPAKRILVESPAARCAECGTAVDSKVVNFCRFKSREFGKRVLCRECQRLVLA